VEVQAREPYLTPYPAGASRSRQHIFACFSVATELLMRRLQRAHAGRVQYSASDNACATHRLLWQLWLPPQHRLWQLAGWSQQQSYRTVSHTVGVNARLSALWLRPALACMPASLQDRGRNETLLISPCMRILAHCALPAGTPACAAMHLASGSDGVQGGGVSRRALGSARAVLLGPVQAATYLLNHGLLAGALGGLLAGRAPWALGVPAAAAVRVAGQLGFIALSGWTMNENLWALLLSNVFALLVRRAGRGGRGMEQH
jgi:hypothetical protein